MLIKDCIKSNGSDVDSLMGRFGGNEGLLVKFLKKFPQDTSFNSLEKAMAAKEYEEIEHAAHTLKGVSANLGMENLSGNSAKLVEAVREHNYDLLDGLFQLVEAEYTRVIKNIEELD